MHNDNASATGPDKSRRAFLILVPLGLLAGVFTSVATAAYRFLKPRISESSNKWIDVAPLADLTGNLPLPKKIVAEQIAGWATSTEEHFVYVLPAKNNQVLSAVCPHEGCEVSWQTDTNLFSCPCHESYFAADGSRISGPARRGLDPLPTRLQDGKLQVQYQAFENNTERRITRS
jgi:menaquinol-cytochrome c reductase iron-sulfur subunit